MKAALYDLNRAIVAAKGHSDKENYERAMRTLFPKATVTYTTLAEIIDRK